MSIEAVLATEPATLTALESALGVTVRRDAATDEAWMLRRDNPRFEVSFLYVAFIGRNLRQDANPTVAELRLFADDLDLSTITARVRGQGELRGGGSSWDPYHQAAPTQNRTFLAWQGRRGTFTIHDDRSKVFWRLDDPPFAAQPDPTDDVVARVAALLSAPIDLPAIERAFGPLVIDGRWPERAARGTTWKLTVRPADGDPADVQLSLQPPLSIAAVATALHWAKPAVIATGVHMTHRILADRATGRAPVVFGRRIEFVLNPREEIVAIEIRPA